MNKPEKSTMTIVHSSARDPAQQFDAIVEEQISHLPTTRLFKHIEQNTLHLAHYHALLTTLFHQTYYSPYTFARAAVNCDWRHEIAKEYLLRHAEEEHSHWRWVLDDLASTGYPGPNPRPLPPHPTCQGYIGLNYFVAEHWPVARLAIAAVLEGIGARYGGTYGRRLIEALALKPSQASFLLSHGETDKTHSVELREIIGKCSLSEEEWLWMHQTASTAGLLYRAMYDHEGYS